MGKKRFGDWKPGKGLVQRRVREENSWESKIWGR